MLYQIISFFMFFQFAAFSTGPSDVESKALEKAISDELPLLSMNIIVDDIPRTIVILGESHVKRKNLADKEMELINSFSYRFLETYNGNGKLLWLKEKMLLAYISVLYPYLEFIESSESSSIIKTSNLGLYCGPDGKIFFHGQYIGLVLNDGFYHDDYGLESVLKQISSKNVPLFFKRLKLFTNKMSSMRRNISDKELAFLDSKRFDNIVIQNEKLDIFNIGIEFGDLRIWNQDKVCGDLLCTLYDSSKPSSRELRMMDSIYQSLVELPELRSGIVIVGKRHLEAFKQLFIDWPKVRDRYLDP
jgi:hypothetical protein